MLSIFSSLLLFHWSRIDDRRLLFCLAQNVDFVIKLLILQEIVDSLFEWPIIPNLMGCSLFGLIPLPPKVRLKFLSHLCLCNSDLRFHHSNHLHILRFLPSNFCLLGEQILECLLWHSQSSFLNLLCSSQDQAKEDMLCHFHFQFQCLMLKQTGLL